MSSDPKAIAPFIEPFSDEAKTSMALLVALLGRVAEAMRELDPDAGAAVMLWKKAVDVVGVEPQTLLIAGDVDAARFAMRDLLSRTA